MAGTDSATAQGPLSPQALELFNWMAVQLAQVANINPREVQPDQPIVRYGLDSPDAIGLALTFEQQLGIPLPPTLFWDYQSLGALAEYVWREHGVTAPTTGPAIG
jgi:acyl carrier protein